MKSTVMVLVKVAAVMVIVSTAVVLVVKYLDTIVNCFCKVKSKICSVCGGRGYDGEIAYDDIDLEDICLDPGCPCNE